MIMPSSHESVAEPGPKRDGDVITLHQGGVHLTLRSRSRLRAFRMLVPNSMPKSRTISAYPPNVSTLTCKNLKPPTSQSLTSRGDATKYFATSSSTVHWRAMKLCANQMSFVLPRQPVLSTLGDILITPQPIAEHHQSLASSQEAAHPCIIVTPPDECSTTLNSVPTPQNAAYGMQLTVPDPEFNVINPQDPILAEVRTEVCSTNSSDTDQMDSTEGENAPLRDVSVVFCSLKDVGCDEPLDLVHAWCG